MFDPKICDLKDGMIMIIRQIYGSPMRLFQICINKLKLIKNFDCKNKRVSIFNQGLGMIWRGRLHIPWPIKCLVHVYKCEAQTKTVQYPTHGLRNETKGNNYTQPPSAAGPARCCWMFILLICMFFVVKKNCVNYAKTLVQQHDNKCGRFGKTP